jgi:hypothetical protein
VAVCCYCDFEPNVPTRFVYIESGDTLSATIENLFAITIVVCTNNFVKTVTPFIKTMLRAPSWPTIPCLPALAQKGPTTRAAFLPASFICRRRV